jgi:glucose/arabinose dehydrogenase
MAKGNRVVQPSTAQRVSAAAGAAIAVWLALALGPGTQAADAALHLDHVASFNQPIFVAAPPDDPNRLFVVQRHGRIGVVRNGEKLSDPFLRIPGGVSTDGERGLLSMAFHPRYAENRKFYVFYTLPGGGDIQIDEFLRSASSANRANPASQRHVLRIEHSMASNHNGGTLQFDADRLLYISVGDGASSENAQDRSTLLGKILRIDPRGTEQDPYDVPSDNPFVGTAGRDAIWAYGLRNPFRFSFDRETGDIAIGDVGQSAWEEVDFRASGEASGANFGWDCFEGDHATPGGGTGCLRPMGVEHEDPALEYAHVGGNCSSVTGGYVIRDPTLEDLQGDYIYGDFCREDHLRTAQLTTTGATNDTDLGIDFDPGGLASFGEDAAGHIHLVSLTGDEVLRLRD